MARSTVIGRALLFGAVSGLRSMIGTAIISRHLAAAHSPRAQSGALSLLYSSGAAKVLTVMAAGEVIADKLPALPARTQPASLAVRALLGAIAGAAACSEESENAAAGALLGAGAAVAATFGAYYLRRWLTKEIGLPDPIVAVAEDAVAYKVGQYAVTL